MWGDIFEGFTDAFDSADSWFSSAIDKIDGDSILNGAQKIHKLVSEKDSREGAQSQSLLNRITSTESGASSSAPSAPVKTQAQQIREQGSEDFYAWEKRWLKRMNGFYNPDSTEVRLS